METIKKKTTCSLCGETGHNKRSCPKKPIEDIAINDDLIEDDVNQEIAMAIKNWEPRARLINVQSVIQPDLNNIFCRIEFQVISTGSIEVIETSVARLR
mgnify:CR=1 FL=1